MHEHTCTHTHTHSSVETGSGQPGVLGQPGHVLFWSSGYDSVYELSGSDPDSALNHIYSNNGILS